MEKQVNKLYPYLPQPNMSVNMLLHAFICHNSLVVISSVGRTMHSEDIPHQYDLII